MIISNSSELDALQEISEIVGVVLKETKKQAKAGVTTRQLDEFAAEMLLQRGAVSAPKKMYGFPGYTCICVNHEAAHGIPSERALQEGDLLNIDVSAEKNGFWADNGSSMVVGRDVNGHQPLVNASKNILGKAIASIRAGERISDTSHLIASEAKRLGFNVIKNLSGHGIGRALHEDPYVLNYREKRDRRRFRKGSVIAIETFISTLSTQVSKQRDGWTMMGDRGGFVAQHEHTIVVTEKEPIVLTKSNGF